MEKHNRRDEIPCDASFYYCPYSPGIMVTHPAADLSILPIADRRKIPERRTQARQRKDRRMLQVPVCPQYATRDCSYTIYPAFRNRPAQLLALCHSKSIARYLRGAAKGKKNP